jgi:L-asparaginase II
MYIYIYIYPAYIYELKICICIHTYIYIYIGNGNTVPTLVGAHALGSHEDALVQLARAGAKKKSYKNNCHQKMPGTLTRERFCLGN